MSIWKMVAVSLFAGIVLNAAVLTVVALTWFFTLPAAHDEAAERHWHYYQELNVVSE